MASGNTTTEDILTNIENGIEFFSFKGYVR